jgi:phasin family protein
LHRVINDHKGYNMTSLPEQLSAARRSQIEAQLELLHSLSSRAISNAHQVIALNLNATRSSVEQSSAAVRQLLEARDPRDLLALGTQGQQQFQQLMDYGRSLFSIAAGAQLDLQKAMPKLAAQPAAAPSAEAFAPAPAAAPAPAPAEAAPAAAAAAPAPAEAIPAAAAAATDATEQAINAIAEAAHSARPQKAVELGEPQAAPEDGPKETAIASAAGQMAAAAGAPEHPMASLPGKSGKIEIPKMTPVEASPPPAPVSGTPPIEKKQAEQRSQKGSRKK